jgi:hypothetical protein
MTRIAPALFCAAALALGATMVIGCGDSDDEFPEGAVAKVGEAVITKSDFGALGSSPRTGPIRGTTARRPGPRRP